MGLLGTSPALNITSVFGQTTPDKTMEPLKKIITIEEHFVLKKISQKVAAFNIIQNGGMEPNDGSQKTRKFIETASISKEDKEKIGYKNAENLLSL
jgi:hypothetical protein